MAMLRYRRKPIDTHITGGEAPITGDLLVMVLLQWNRKHRSM
jgi:hypothetical protein